MESKTTTDRISSLPEPIIHQILSFLPTKDVKVTSSLSETWYRISKSFPYLDFDEPWNRITPVCYFDYDNVDRYFNRHGSPIFDHEYSPLDHELEPSELQRDHLDKYVNYVGETLRRFNDHNEPDVPVRRLSIPITFFPRITTPLLDTWISLVMQHPIEEFNLKIRYPDDYFVIWPFYDLPPSFFASKSIKVVKLCVCSLLSSFAPNMMTSNLVQLSLWYVVLDDIILSSIISTCPLIEELSIVRCRGIKCLRISDLNKLKSLQISHWLGEENEIVEIDAPSLQSLKIDGMGEIRVLECPKLRHLDLESLEIMKDFLQNFLSRLSFLRSLSLSILSLTKVKISSDTLNKLRVVNCCTLVELEIDAPNLLSVEYQGDFFPLSLSVHKVTGRWHVSTYYRGWENPLKVEDFLVRLREFVTKLKHIEYLSLDLWDILPYSFEELNERAISQPAINIGHLDLQVNLRSKISYPDILDCVLWSCHPRTLSLKLVILPIFWNENIGMGIHDVIMHHHRCSFLCNLAGSWFHCVEEMIYETHDGNEEYRLPMDGISSIRPLRHSDRAVKFIFRW